MDRRALKWMPVLMVLLLLATGCGLLIEDDVSDLRGADAPPSAEGPAGAGGDVPPGASGSTGTIPPASEVESSTTTLPRQKYRWCNTLSFVINSPTLDQVSDTSATKRDLTTFQNALEQIAADSGESFRPKVIQLRDVIDQLLISIDDEADPAEVESEMRVLQVENLDLTAEVITVALGMCDP